MIFSTSCLDQSVTQIGYQHSVYWWAKYLIGWWSQSFPRDATSKNISFLNCQCNPWLSRLTTLNLLLSLTACTGPTALNTQWLDSQFTDKPMRSILVVGITKDTSIRRVYEDAMVAQLTARGVKAKPSYLFAPESGPMPRQVMENALADFGASGVIVTRVVNVSQSVRVTPSIPSRSVGPRQSRTIGMRNFYSFYDSMWANNFHSPPTITVQEKVATDTSLFETKNFTLVWSASTTTTNGSGNATVLLQQFSDLISETLAKDGLI